MTYFKISFRKIRSILNYIAHGVLYQGLQDTPPPPSFSFNLNMRLESKFFRQGKKDSFVI